MGDRLVADRALSGWSLQKDRSWGLDGKMDGKFVLSSFLFGRKGQWHTGFIESYRSNFSPNTYIQM